jgi:uncharacterized protein YcaQ
MQRSSVLINVTATALLQQLLEKHPEATDDELWELFRLAAEDDDGVRAAIAVEKLHLKSLH